MHMSGVSLRFVGAGAVQTRIQSTAFATLFLVFPGHVWLRPEGSYAELGEWFSGLTLLCDCVCSTAHRAPITPVSRHMGFLSKFYLP